MCIPLTPAQKEQLEAEKQTAQNRIDKYIEIAPKRAEQVAKKQLTDDGFKAAYDYYDGIVVAYENEREELDGTYVQDPVTETDIDNPASLIPSRTTPINPATDIVRISQYDGTPLITIDNDIPGVGSDIGTTQLDIEPYWISKQEEVADWLQNGLGGTSPTITPTTFVVDAITPSTTQITIETTVETENPTFAVGDRFVIEDGSTQVGIEITGIVSETPGSPGMGFCTGETPPGSGVDETTCLANGGVWTPPTPSNFTGTYDIIVLTGGSVGASGSIDETWSGYSDSDRAAKVDSTDGYTQMLLDMISQLETYANNRITKLNNQETQLNANSDPDLDGTALTNVQSSRTFLQNYLLTTDVSDTGLTGINNESSTRDSQITARIAAINSAFTTQPTGNFFDLRYNAANDRGNTSRGTLRILRFEEGTNDVIADISASLQDRIDAIDNLLANACP